MEQLSRRISPIALFMLSVNAIIGSGWLFAPFYAAKIAGSAAIFSWLIGGSAAILIAFTFAELSTMLPVAGGTAYIPQISHGALTSFILSWIGWLSTLLLTPIEVQAVLQYASLFFPSLMHDVHGVPVMTLTGYLWATILMLSLCVINIVSYRGLMRFNCLVFFIKTSVIIFTIVAILSTRFNAANFSGLFVAPFTSHGWKSILSAVATGGVVLAFNGFKSGIEMAGEAKRFALAIPVSAVGGVGACLLLYLGLQICFIGALDPSQLQAGWSHLHFTGDTGPLIGLASLLGLALLYKLLYVNAVVSPLGSGLIYVTSTARILYAMSKMGYVPRFLSRLNHQHFPMWAIAVNFVIGMLSFLPLPGWQAMVNFLVSAIVITYAMGPIALLSLRLSLPDKTRPFRLPAANFLCLLAFYCCNLFSYWTGWETISKLGIALSIGLLLYAIAYSRGTVKVEKKEFKSLLWLLPYLGGLVAISYFGSFGGSDRIPFGWDFVVIGLFSAGILYVAVKCRIPQVNEAALAPTYSTTLAMEGIK